MGNTFGRRVLTDQTTGNPFTISVDGMPEWKAFGVTLDWSKVTAVATNPVTLMDGTRIPVGKKYIRYGTTLCEVGVGEVQTITITGTPTGGTFTITFNGETTSALAYNASAADVKNAIDALPTLTNTGGITVALAGAVYTITFPPELGNVPAVTTTNSFTGGTSPNTTIATTTAGVGSGQYAPYNSGASDGTQTLTRGRCFVLERTVLEDDANSNHPPVIEGGIVWADRIAFVDDGGPTEANFLTAFPRIRLHR